MALTGTHVAGDASHVTDHNLIDAALAAMVTSVAGRTGAVTLTGVDVAGVVRTINSAAPDGAGNIVLATGGSSLTPVAAKTASYSANANELVPVSTAAGAATVTLPTLPVTGAVIGVYKTDISANLLTIAPAAGGNINGDVNATTTTKNGGATFEHLGANAWAIVAAYLTTGPAGPTGPAGSTGATGSTGTTGATGTAGAISLLQSAGVALTVRPTINFVGAGVAATDDAVNSRTLVTISSGGGSGSAGFTGDGSDGALVMDGTSTILGFNRVGTVYTATRNIYATTFTVNSGVTVSMSAFVFHATGVVTINGNINANGISAVNSGSAGSFGNQVLSGNPSGGAGSTGAGAVGSSTPGFTVTAASGGAGGTGGTGAAGAGGVTNNLAANPGTDTSRVRHTATTSWLLGNNSSRIGGGAGGGGGGGDGTNPGGGGGAGGAILIINAFSLVNNGAIQARGGNGAAGLGGNSGGGGGGGGGVVFINVTTAVTGTGTVDANAGTGGALAGTGTAGSAGTVGSVRTTVWS